MANEGAHFLVVHPDMMEMSDRVMYEIDGEEIRGNIWFELYGTQEFRDTAYGSIERIFLTAPRGQLTSLPGSFRPDIPMLDPARVPLDTPIVMMGGYLNNNGTGCVGDQAIALLGEGYTNIVLHPGGIIFGSPGTPPWEDPP